MYFPNVSQRETVKSLRMVEAPRPKKLLLPMLDAADDREKSEKEDFALKKIIKMLKGDMIPWPSEADLPTTTDPDSDTIDRSGESLLQELTPVSTASSASKLDTDVVARNRSTSPSNNENANTDTRMSMRLVDGSIPGIVKVRMQNTSVIEGGATRLIYSVHLDGKPVPAETAARDMALLSPQEVALELGAPVIIQSERE